MSGGDRTGPMGRGPMTGRGRGWCGGAGTAVNMPQRGRGPGMARGGGWGGGWRHRYWYYETGLPGWQRASMGGPGLGGWALGPFSREQELVALKEEAVDLGQTLDGLNARIRELEKPTDTTPAAEGGDR